jgi:pimeloyl-ACP methyl ester carboxylesterase
MSRTLLMIHGGFCGGWYFDGFRAYFEQAGWTCLTPDLPYHDTRAIDGDADPHLAEMGIADYTQAMTRVVDGLEEPPIVIGHSLGGLITQQLAAKGRCRAAILLTPAAPWGIPPATADEVAAAMGLMAAGPFWSMALTPVFEIAAGNSIDKLAPEEQRQVFERFTPESGKVLFESMFWHLDLNRAAAVEASNVTCPMLCVAGGDDKVISPATVKRVADTYASAASYQEFAGFSHWLIGEPGWQTIAQACADWIDGLPAE